METNNNIMNNQMLVAQYSNFVEKLRGLELSSISHHERYPTQFFNSVQKPLASITITDIYGYFMSLREIDRPKCSRYYHKGAGKISSGTIKNMCTIIRQFFEWANITGHTSIDSNKIAIPRAKTVKVSGLEEYEVRLLLEAPREFNLRDDVMYRDTILFCLGYYLGLRASEACNVTFDQLTQSHITVTGKGKKRVLPIPFIIQDLAKKYKKIRGGTIKIKQEYTTRNGKKAFRTYTCVDKNPNHVITCLDSVNYGRPLNPDNLGFIFRRYEKLLGLSERITFHLLRHSFCSHLLQAGVDDYTAQYMMGHTNIMATQHYIDVGKNQTKEAQMKILNNGIVFRS